MLNKEYLVVKDDYANMGKNSSLIKKTLIELGIDNKIIRKIAVASYEAEINMVIHAYGGKIYFSIDDDGLIKLVFHDDGPGIPDIEKAMTPGWSTASAKAREMGFGAGMGLVNIQRYSDSFDLRTSPEGTIITICFNGA